MREALLSWNTLFPNGEPVGANLLRRCVSRRYGHHHYPISGRHFFGSKRQRQNTSLSMGLLLTAKSRHCMALNSTVEQHISGYKILRLKTQNIRAFWSPGPDAFMGHRQTPIMNSSTFTCITTGRTSRTMDFILQPVVIWLNAVTYTITPQMAVNFLCPRRWEEAERQITIFFDITSLTTMEQIQPSTSVGWLLGSGRGNQAYGNVSYNQDTGFAIGNDAVENLLYNNISYNNRLYGINVYGVWGGSDRAMVFNNTVYQNSLYGIVARDGAKNTRIKNNISYKNGPDSSRNIWLHPDQSPGTVTENNLIVDPHFMNPSSYDFHLQPASQAINAGLTIPEVKVDFFGVKRGRKAYDIGAIEYETLADSTAPATPKDLKVAN